MTIYYVHKDNLLREQDIIEQYRAHPDLIAVVTVADHDARVEQVYQQTLYGD